MFELLQFIALAAIEAFDIPILPGTSWRDEGYLYPHVVFP